LQSSLISIPDQITQWKSQLLGGAAGVFGGHPEPGAAVEAVDISRSSVYCRQRGVSAEDLSLMRQIDELHLNYPFAGSRMKAKTPDEVYCNHMPESLVA
jgi:hypothetical protein